MGVEEHPGRVELAAREKCTAEPPSMRSRKIASQSRRNGQ